MDEIDIHNRRRSLERAIIRVQNSDLSQTNKNLILRFKDECLSNGLGIDRTLFYLDKLCQVAKRLKKDFTDATKEDLKEIVRQIELKQDYSEWTKRGYKITLKKFYRWVEGADEEYPERVSWIKTGIKKNREKLTNLPTQEEVERLIDTACAVRDKAFVSVLYESGCRIGELLNVRLKDVEFDDYGATILVKGKTGARRIRLVSSVPRLSVWIEHHPGKDNPESPLWINTGTLNHEKAMMYQNARQILRDLAKKANISKRVNPHSLRKARATHLASKLTEAQMCEYFGWTQGSNMPFTYVHLSGRDIDEAILKMHGKVPKDNHATECELKKCPRCLYENPPDSHFCIRCRLPLDEKTAIEIEQRKKEFISTTITSEIIEKMVEEKVRQMLAERNQDRV